MAENKDLTFVLASIYALKMETSEVLHFREQSCCNPPTDLCMEVLRISMLDKDVISNND